MIGYNLYLTTVYFWTKINRGIAGVHSISFKTSEFSSPRYKTLPSVSSSSISLSTPTPCPGHKPKIFPNHEPVRSKFFNFGDFYLQYPNPNSVINITLSALRLRNLPERGPTERRKIFNTTGQNQRFLHGNYIIL